DGGHAAAGGDAFNAVMVELIARMEWSHWQARVGGERPRASRALTKIVGPPPVHAHAFDASNADELHADIIAAVSLVGKRHQLLGGGREAVTVGDEVGDFGCGHRAVQAVRAKHQNVGGKQLKVVRVDADEQVSS